MPMFADTSQGIQRRSVVEKNATSPGLRITGFSLFSPRLYRLPDGKLGSGTIMKSLAILRSYAAARIFAGSHEFSRNSSPLCRRFNISSWANTADTFMVTCHLFASFQKHMTV